MAIYVNGVLVAVAPAAHEVTHVDGGSDDIDSALLDAAIPGLAASKITSLRFPMTRMPAGTATHVPTAQGAGVSPAYAAAAGGGLTFTELISATHQVGAVPNWEDWDVSGIVPAGTVAVLVGAVPTTLNSRIVGARKNGSALVRTFQLPAIGDVIILTECDGSRIIEIKGVFQTTSVNFRIYGYWS